MPPLEAFAESSNGFDVAARTTVPKASEIVTSIKPGSVNRTKAHAWGKTNGPRRAQAKIAVSIHGRIVT